MSSHMVHLGRHSPHEQTLPVGPVRLGLERVVETKTVRTPDLVHGVFHENAAALG